MATYNNYHGNSSNRQPDMTSNLTTRPQGTAQNAYQAMQAPTPALQAGAAPLTPCEAAALMGRPLTTASLPSAAYTPGWTPGMAPSAGPAMPAAGMMMPAAQMPSMPAAYPAPSIYTTTAWPAAAAQMPAQAMGQHMVVGEPPPMTVTSPYYFAGKLSQYIGRLVRVEFVLGTSGQISDRIGNLIEVGASYVSLQPLATNDVLICDLYSIKFVTVYLGPAAGIGAE